jgi:hypothetical protein
MVISLDKGIIITPWKKLFITQYICFITQITNFSQPQKTFLPLDKTFLSPRKKNFIHPITQGFPSRIKFSIHPVKIVFPLG